MQAERTDMNSRLVVLEVSAETGDMAE